MGGYLLSRPWSATVLWQRCMPFSTAKRVTMASCLAKSVLLPKPRLGLGRIDKMQLAGV
jgi:hypothetical protein